MDLSKAKIFDVTTDATESALQRALSAACAVVYIPYFKQGIASLIRTVMWRKEDGWQDCNVDGYGSIYVNWWTTNGEKKVRIRGWALHKAEE